MPCISKLIRNWKMWSLQETLWKTTLLLSPEFLGYCATWNIDFLEINYHRKLFGPKRIGRRQLWGRREDMYGFCYLKVWPLLSLWSATLIDSFLSADQGEFLSYWEPLHVCCYVLLNSFCSNIRSFATISVLSCRNSTDKKTLYIRCFK